MTDAERLQKVLDYLKMSAAELAKNLGFARPERLYHVLKGRNRISEQLAKEITTKYNIISYTWLVFEHGEMLVEQISVEDALKIAKKETINFLTDVFKEKVNIPNSFSGEGDSAITIMMVPLVHQYAYAGYFRGYSDEQYVGTLPKIPFLVTHNGKGKYMCFEVKGDSMNDGSENSYIEGDRLLCREIDSEYWKSKLHYKKWDFIIVHKTEGILLKQITNQNLQEGTITLHSINPDYEDTVVKLSDVLRIFNVIELQRPMKK